jgi:hypothetical protein
MRLAGGVAHEGLALAHHGGHQDVLGAGDRGFVKEHLGTGSGPLHRKVVAAVEADGGAQLLQAIEMRVQPAAADHVAAGRKTACLAGAVQQRRHTQDGGAHLVAQGAADLTGIDTGHLDADTLATALDRPPISTISPACGARR